MVSGRLGPVRHAHAVRENAYITRYGAPVVDGRTAEAIDSDVRQRRARRRTKTARINLVLYHGVLAPRAAWRPEAVPRPAALAADAGAAEDVRSTREPSAAHAAWRCWAALMRRAFGFDVLACARCGGRLRLRALLDASDVTRRILRHLGLPTEVPAARPARAPPVYDDAA